SFPLWAADRAKQHSTAVFSQSQRLLREGETQFVDRLPADIPGKKLERVMKLFGYRLQHLHGFGNDLSTHSITGQYGYLCVHRLLSLLVNFDRFSLYSSTSSSSGRHAGSTKQRNSMAVGPLFSRDCLPPGGTYTTELGSTATTESSTVNRPR